MAFHLLVVLPSPSANKVSTLKCGFRSSILGLWFPLSTLNSTPYDAKPMTRGLGVCLPYQVEDLHLRSSTDLSRRTGCPANCSGAENFETALAATVKGLE